MGVFSKIGRELRDAFQINLDFLTKGIGEFPPEGSLLANELRTLVERDMAILIHKRSKWSDDNEPAKARWFEDLEAFVSRSLRPQLAGESIIALWNDVTLMRTLDAMVASEQVALARSPKHVPVTCRFDSHWAT